MLVLLAVLSALLLYAFAERVRAPEGLPLTSLETGEGVSQRSRNLDVTRTRRGLPSLRVGAVEAITYRDGRTELHDVTVTVFDESGHQTTIASPLANSLERASGGWSFRDGVVLVREDGLRVEVPELVYRESPPEVDADGKVLFSAGSLHGTAKGLRYLVARRRLDLLSEVDLTSEAAPGGLRRLTADSGSMDSNRKVVTFLRYEALGEEGARLSGTSLEVSIDESGEARRIREMKALRGFRVEIPGVEGPEGSPARLLTGESLELHLAEDGTFRHAVAEGGVRLSEGDPDRDPRSLSCEHLEADFPKGRLNSLVAMRSAHLRVPAADRPDGLPANISAERIWAQFDPATGEMAAVEAETDVTASQGERTLQAPWLRYEVSPARWWLRGDTSAPARLSDAGATVSAARMEIDRAGEKLEAEGDVKTAYRDPGPPADASRVSGSASASGFDGLFGPGEGMLHAMAERLQLDLGSKRARYSGKVRVWRGGGSIEAATVDYSQKDGIVEAHEGVVARIPIEKSERSTAGTVTVSAREMRYDQKQMDARFEGSVIATASGMRIEAERMHASGASLHGLTQMEAEGTVSLRQGTLRGEGDRMHGDFKAETFTLFGDGRLAMIQDESNQQVARGAVLTYERSTGRIQVESESGGRTWITLRPTSERGEPGDPKSPR
jgi:lipopolysaccharide transport protein LptA